MKRCLILMLVMSWSNLCPLWKCWVFLLMTIWVLMSQCGKLNFGGTRPKTNVPYMFFTKFHSPGPIFYLPSLKCTCIGERASVSFPHSGRVSILCVQATWQMNAFIRIVKYIPHVALYIYQAFISLKYINQAFIPQQMHFAPLVPFWWS